MMIEVNKLYKKFKQAEFASVDNLSFSFPLGKIVGLLGPNGAGKTTTISILSGLLKDYTGDIKILGLNPATQSQEIKQLIGIVPQQIALYNSLSCQENLDYFGRLYGMSSLKRKQIITDYLHAFGLFDHAHKLIKSFSGGMKRRANILATLLNQPKLLILDEPTAGVDVQSRSMILNFLKQYNQEGNSIVYTSHLLDEAESICDEVLIIDSGKKIAQGTPQELISTHQALNLEDLFLKLTGNKLRD